MPGSALHFLVSIFAWSPASCIKISMEPPPQLSLHIKYGWSVKKIWYWIVFILVQSSPFFFLFVFYFKDDRRFRFLDKKHPRTLPVGVSLNIGYTLTNKLCSAKYKSVSKQQFIYCAVCAVFEGKQLLL